MSSESIGAYGFLVLFILMAAGLPIGVAMGMVGFLGLMLILPAQAAIAKMAIAPFELVSSYAFATLPLFLLMGHVLLATGQGGNLFMVAKKWFGRVPGGLAMATVAGCAAFGAVCASSIATAVTLGLVAIPEMKKAGYDGGFANGTVAAGGTIGSLIPPSGFMIIYGILTENSIAKLFVGGIIPGIVVSLSYILMIGIRCLKKPELGPPGEKVSIKEKIKTLRDIWELFLLGGVSIGGLIGGIFTSTEAGAVGALGAFLSAIVRQKLTWEKTKEALLETMKTAGMIYAVLIGATLFNYFMAASNLPEHLFNWVSGFKLSPMGVMTILVIIYIIMGALMDETSTQLLTIPIFYPLILKLGFDPIWFGVLQARLLQIGMIAPPVGINVFVIAGLDKTVPMQAVYRGVIQFLFMDMFTMAVFMIWPQTILWLPNLLR
jgi:tripartite ATP-independent transporter DctM subunit